MWYSDNAMVSVRERVVTVASEQRKRLLSNAERPFSVSSMVLITRLVDRKARNLHVDLVLAL